MASRRRARALLALLALAGLVGLGWLVRGTFLGDGPATPAGERPRADDDGEEALPGLLGRGEERPARDAGALAPEPKPEPARAGFRVRGRVTGTDAFPAGSVVFVRVRLRNRYEYLARDAPGAGGAFHLEVPAPEEDPPWHAEIGVDVPGRARPDLERRDVGPGADVAVEIALPAGERVRARVLDTDGRAVPGLKVALLFGGARPFLTHELPDWTREEAHHSPENDLRATARTGPDGRFLVEGVSDGLLAVVAYDDAWWLEVPERHGLVPGEDEVEVVARPGFRLDVTLSAADPSDDPATWRPSLAFDVPAHGSVGSLGVGAFGRTFVVRGAVPEDALDGFTATLAADTADHPQVRREVGFRPGAWRQRVAITLARRPAGEYGTLVLEPGVRDGNGRPAQVAVVHQRRTGERSWTGDHRPVEVRPDGTYAVSLPAGRQPIDVGVGLPLGETLRWKGEVDVERGRETRLTWPAAGVASLRVVFPRSARGESAFLAFARDGVVAASWTGTVPEEDLRFPAVAEGTWQVRAQVGTTAVPRTLTLVAGEEGLLDLSR